MIVRQKQMLYQVQQCCRLKQEEYFPVKIDSQLFFKMFWRHKPKIPVSIFDEFIYKNQVVIRL